jgi:hypothetical protein
MPTAPCGNLAVLARGGLMQRCLVAVKVAIKLLDEIESLFGHFRFILCGLLLLK